MKVTLESHINSVFICFSPYDTFLDGSERNKQIAAVKQMQVVLVSFIYNKKEERQNKRPE